MTTKIRAYKAASLQEKHHNASRHYHSAQKVGDAFIEQYYNVLRYCPDETHKFYKDESTISRQRDNGKSLITTIKEIVEEIMCSEMTNSTIIILDMQAQDTIAKCVLVGVLGLCSKDNMLKCFSQSFLLAPQATGFYVQNDILRYLNTHNDTEYYLCSMKDKIISTKEQDGHDVNEISDSSYTKNSALPNELTNILLCQAKDTTTESVLEVLEKDQNHKSSSTKEAFGFERDQLEKNPHPNAKEAEKKESYTTIVGKAISLPVSPLASAQVLADKSSTIVSATTQSAATRMVKTIFVKNLPPHVTRKSLTHALEGCGPIKHKNIQIRGYHDGYRYAFVEFNNPRAAHQAVKTGSINFDGWECQIEYKKVHTEVWKDVYY